MARILLIFKRKALFYGFILPHKDMAIQLLHFESDDRVEECAEVQTKTGLTAIKIKADGGWKTIDSVYDPVQEAKTIAGEKASNYLLLGAGSGYVACQITDGHAKHILIITGSRNLAYKNQMLLRDDNHNALKITIISSDVSNRQIFGLVKSFLETYPDTKVLVHPGESKAFPRLFNPLLSWVEYIRKPFKRKKALGIQRVLFPQQGQILEPDIMSFFEEKGIKTISLPSFARAGIDHRKAYDILRKHESDLVFSINNRGSDRNGFIPETCRFAGILWATWFLDEPRFLVLHCEARTEQGRINFCWDDAGIDSSRELGLGSAHLLPLAANHRVFTPGRGRDELSGRLVYVGSPSFGNEERYFAALRKKPEAEIVADIFEDNVKQTRKTPDLREIRDALRSEGIEENRFTNDELTRIPAFSLYKANLHYRVEVLRSLADLRPIVFGDGWEGLLPETVTLKPYADYYRELPDIYRSDAVHLSLTHLQMRRYPNQRVFDAGACGRVVIGEMLPGCGELFEGSILNLFAKTVEELRYKAELLLNDKMLRKSYGEQLREAVLKNHTMNDRLDKIIETLSEPARYEDTTAV